MKAFILTPAAEAELQSIVDFIRRDDPEMALHVLGAIEYAMELIAENPGIGRVRDDLVEEDLRVWVVYSYLIVYRPTARPLEVVHVIHGARDLATALGKERSKRAGRGHKRH
jgi:antitoxin ParD1/3/4/toxin ParE1/3/4